MHWISKVPWELLTIIGFFISALVIPFFVGRVVIKLYRKNHPEKLDEAGFVTRIEGESYGFFKSMLVGWLICIPVILLMYWFS